jgi:transcriptional regulator with XRE-family HTH domain
MMPAIARKLLKAELRQLREARDLTPEAVRRAMEWSISKIVRIEKGDVTISANDLRALLSMYEVEDASEVERLLALARTARQRTWLTSYRNVIKPSLQDFFEYEIAASRIRQFQALVLPALVQTEGYMRALIGDASPVRPSNDELDARVEVRTKRQQAVLERKRDVELVTILDEAVLRRPVGSPQIMHQQLDHLVALGESEAVDIVVLPYSVGAHPGLSGTFELLDFDFDDVGTMLFLELPYDTALEDDREQVETYELTFTTLSEIGSHGKDAFRLIRAVQADFAP